MQEFINPKSMMTPGVAGATMMFFVNGLAFAFPELQPRIVALLLSFLIGSIVFAAQSNPPPAAWAKTIYWFVNSLIIFVVGFGTAHFAADTTVQNATQAQNNTLLPLLISAANAQSGNNEIVAATKILVKPESYSKKQLIELLKHSSETNEKLEMQLNRSKNIRLENKDEEALGRTTNVIKSQQESQFFKRW